MCVAKKEQVIQQVTRNLRAKGLELVGIGLVGLMMLMAGCATKTGHAQAQGEAAVQAATSSDSLALTQWCLTHWITAVGKVRPLPQEAKHTALSIAFLVRGGAYRVSGFSGCNRFSGTYQLRRGVLSITVPKADSLRCTNPLRAKLEHAYLNGLSHIASFTLDSGGAPQHMTLSLQNGDIMSFMRGEDLPNR